MAAWLRAAVQQRMKERIRFSSASIFSAMFQLGDMYRPSEYVHNFIVYPWNVPWNKLESLLI